MSAPFSTPVQVRVLRVLGVTAQAWGLSEPHESARVMPLPLPPTPTLPFSAQAPRRRRAIAHAPFFAISY
ncbi:hypothetical protein [Acidovorax sp. SUPP3334]|uniref:hypothetical protein n=1 Tax=Acidovorax sp. SUPP3334 TaxID=2920881 RepID=UPI0023DE1D2A|nr:hypothetical protein [Acidovorax sp. SUPP3334]GKT20679.1 hypothetical protein AVHM3334_01985 [Acidovorax sp. SUPP3334]